MGIKDIAPHLSSSVCLVSVASRQVGNNATGSDGDIAYGCHRNKTRLNLNLCFQSERLLYRREPNGVRAEPGQQKTRSCRTQELARSRGRENEWQKRWATDIQSNRFGEILPAASA